MKKMADKTNVDVNEKNGGRDEEKKWWTRN